MKVYTDIIVMSTLSSAALPPRLSDPSVDELVIIRLCELEDLIKCIRPLDARAIARTRDLLAFLPRCAAVNPRRRKGDKPFLVSPSG